MNPESACGIGLIPKELLDCIIPVGNLAGKGAQIAALNEDEYQKSKDLAKEADFVELALDPDFQDVYVDEDVFFMKKEEDSWKRKELNSKSWKKSQRNPIKPGGLS